MPGMGLDVSRSFVSGDPLCLLAKDIQPQGTTLRYRSKPPVGRSLVGGGHAPLYLIETMILGTSLAWELT